MSEERKLPPWWLLRLLNNIFVRLCWVDLVLWKMGSEDFADRKTYTAMCFNYEPSRCYCGARILDKDGTVRRFEPIDGIREAELYRLKESGSGGL